MILGNLVARNGHLAQEVLGLHGEVVDYMDMIFGSASGGGGGMSDSPLQTAAIGYGSSYYHLDIDTFDVYGWTSGAYSGANWTGHDYSIDVTKFWTPTSTDITVQQSVTDFWGSSFSGPGYDWSQGHSQSEQSLDIRSQSFGQDGLSQFIEHDQSNQSFDFSHEALPGLSIDSQHSDRTAMSEIHQISLGAGGVSGSDQIAVSHDTSDSFHFVTPTGATQQTSSVHDDLTLADWFSNGSNGSSVATNHSEHIDQSVSGIGFADFSSHDVAVHQVATVAHYDLHV
jgi:hypothetical protein